MNDQIELLKLISKLVQENEELKNEISSLNSKVTSLINILSPLFPENAAYEGAVIGDENNTLAAKFK